MITPDSINHYVGVHSNIIFNILLLPYNFLEMKYVIFLHTTNILVCHDMFMKYEMHKIYIITHVFNVNNIGRYFTDTSKLGTQ